MKKLTSLYVDPNGDLSSRTKHVRQLKKRFLIKELGGDTFPDFARVVEKHNGVWGGCWCTAFHLKRSEEKEWTGKHRTLKEKLVREDRSHAALAYDGADVVGWCQFGPPLELPGRMSGYSKLDVPPPDWRITCFFVDRDHRKEGVSKAALQGALRIIASKGGRDGRRMSNRHARKAILKLILVGWNTLNVHQARIPSTRCTRNKQMDHAKSGP